MDGAEIRRNREARGLTQQQLAEAIGFGHRTVGNWERGETVPLNRMGMLRKFFAVDEDSADPLRRFSEVALLSELLRRASDRQARGTG